MDSQSRDPRSTVDTRGTINTQSPPIPVSQSGPHKCSRCGGRLFLDSRYQGRRLLYVWHCLSCSREFDLGGDLTSYPAEKRKVRVARPVLATRRQYR